MSHQHRSKKSDKLKSIEFPEIADRADVEKIWLRDQAFEAVSEGIVISEIYPNNNGIIYVNESFERITGYTFEEVKNRNCRILQGAETDAATIGVIRTAIAGQRGCSVEILNYRKDGTTFWNAMSIAPVRDKGGQVTHFIGVQQDVTLRRQAEEKLKASQERYRLLAESVPQQVWTALSDGRLDYGNRRTVEYFGKKTQVELSDRGWTKIVHPEDVPDTIARWTRAVETGEPYEIEHRLRRHDGEYRWHLARAVPMLDETGKIIKWLGTNTDIHDRKAAEEDAREAAEYRNLFQNANDAILIIEPETEVVIDANDKACQMYGIEREKFIGKSIREMSKNIERGVNQLQILLEKGTSQSFETVQFHSSGAPIHLLINSTIIDYRGKKVVLSINRDVTESRKTQAALEESQKRYQQLFDSNPHPIWVYDSETLEFLAVNDEATKRYGYSREEFLRLTIKDVRLAEDVPILLEQINQVQLLNTPFSRITRHLKKDGSVIDVEIASQPITFGDRPARLVLATDITERLKAEKQILHNALHDTLTGLPNRALFLEHLRHAIERNGKRGEKRFAVLFLDFDHFKIINDSLGHLEGDNLLRLIARRLTDCLRPGDIVARLGGDEFTILLDDLGDLSDVIQIAERIQSDLMTPFNLNGHEVVTSASVGIALSNSNYAKPDDMLRDADIAMYRAKAGGKARHQMFDQTMHEQANYRLKLETDLRQAVKFDEFLVYFQPIINLQTGRVKGFEALVRWQHPTRGIVSPVEFIPVAEETGLIIPLGEWILRAGCRQLRQWQNEFPQTPSLTLSVNLSCKQFVQKDLVERIIEILDETKIEPDSLRLEVTESHLMEDSEAAIETMKRLRALGIKLSIDDFGTGYSSLSYLHRLPINYLKIDRSFVSQMQFNSENREIVGTIVSLAKNLNLQVIAEGIETIEQADYLKTLGCNFGQGFLYSRPVEANQATLLIKNTFPINPPVNAPNKLEIELINNAAH